MTRAASGIVVTGIGMKTPLGNHSVQSAASVRAGINRFRRWPHFGVDLGDDSGLNASFVNPDMGDDPWTEKAFELLGPPLEEALWSSRLYDLEKHRGKLSAFLALPYPDREGTTTEAFEEFAASLREDCFGEAPVQTEIIALDHASGLVAVARAVEQLQRGHADLCLVGGVDSLLDSRFLYALFTEKRLKVGSRGSGLIPGEGGAFVILERERDAARRKIKPLARVEAIALEKDEPWGPEAPLRAEGLSRALRSVLQVAGAGEIRRVITDLNGERWRFLEWALAETRCLEELPRGWQLWHPADCLGDLGAAYGISAMVLATRAMARGYHGDGKVLISACSERGERAAMCLSAPPRKGTD
ncbi:beta-ketoacyl synthase N-terminal-like domain-containing protein [Hyalangium sp.]|uniref:beta-ketoacyl synthase N-terminal-like domain-containing protein n=1 Tax=Hyalangium sp. TaxID=2028555 RepID=UPI002D5C95EC|nr:beta-ketoacyl synthase N-terminal-like domain-containing protein [Hyalangium sp.]HYI02169.1 beta-ketoacyl synthase N-terminal-like domain-containing protein [Hyalangium sp.]